MVHSAIFREVAGVIALQGHARKRRYRGCTGGDALTSRITGMRSAVRTMETRDTKALQESTIGTRWLLRGRSLQRLVIHHRSTTLARRDRSGRERCHTAEYRSGDSLHLKCALRPRTTILTPTMLNRSCQQDWQGVNACCGIAHKPIHTASSSSIQVGACPSEGRFLESDNTPFLGMSPNNSGGSIHRIIRWREHQHMNVMPSV